MEKNKKAIKKNELNRFRRNEKKFVYSPRKGANYYWHLIDILSCKFERFAKFYEERSIANQYIREYKIFNISKDSKILHIGCGYYPLTELTLQKKLNGNVFGIDNNHKVTDCAEKIVRKKNLQDKIKIFYGDGIDYSFEDFDIIIISSCCYPKDKILDNIIKKGKKNSIVLIREIGWDVKYIENYLNKNKDFCLVKKIISRPFPYYGPLSWITFYLQKK